MSNTLETKRGFRGLSSFQLHIIAMVLMLCDHMWGTIASEYGWLTWIGRLCFPIYAFLIVEGAMHTGNKKKYLMRMLTCAIISEIPFNLMMGGTVLYPYHQNVLWTLMMGLLCIFAVEKAKRWWTKALVFAGTTLVACAIALIGMTDYNHFGILTIMVFYLFRGRKWWQMLGQLAGLYWVNVELFGGMYVPVEIFGTTINVYQQSLAVLAIIPIWLYDGRQGLHNRVTRWVFYGFYPAHILVLSLLAIYVM